MNYIVIEQHETKFPPITLTAGEKVIIGEESTGTWLNWIFCTKIDNSNAGWVPKQIIDYDSETVLQDYSSKELNVSKGMMVEGIKELNGWLWSKNKSTNEIGWVPMENLKQYGKTN